MGANYYLDINWIKLTVRSGSSVMDGKTPDTDVEERKGRGWKETR